MNPNKIHPPKNASRFLQWFLKDELIEEVMGDLEEKFFIQLKEKTPLKAKINYWLQVFHYLRPFALRNNIFSTLIPFFMLRHNLLISIRNIKRNYSSFLINLLGLATGIACTLLIYLWVVDEIKMDKFHENDPQLYQVMSHSHRTSNVETDSYTTGPLAETLKSEIPEVNMAAPSLVRRNGIIKEKEKIYKVSEHYVGHDFFKMFSYSILQGDVNHFLDDKNSVVISDQLAIRLFGSTQNVIGKSIDFTRSQPALSGIYMITGVFQHPPKNSTMQFDMALNWDLYLSKKPNLADWRNSDPETYVLLNKGADPKLFTQKMQAILKEKHPESKYTLSARPYSSAYLYGQYENGVQSGGRITYVRLFSLIAFFILLIACINFMNLSTAKATKRIKEIGIKKAIGAHRSTLISQYLTESMLITFFSLFLAIVIAEMALPYFSVITEKELVITFNMELSLVIIGIALFTGLLSGSYPALYLSGFNPALILKGKINKSIGELWARKGLVIFQFTLSVLLIVGVSVVYQQIKFIQAKNLGYNKNNILTFFREGELEKDIAPFLAELNNLPGIIGSTTLSGNLTKNRSTTTGVYWEGRDDDNPIRFNIHNVGTYFMETLDFELKEGRVFSNEERSEIENIILNEAAVEAMGWKDPIGKTFTFWGDVVTIIGVMKNYHFESLYEEIKPSFLRRAGNGRNILAKIQSGKEKETIAQIEQLYSNFNPGHEFHYHFLDDDFDQLYAAEHRVSILSRYFAGVGILISCLGLFGLTAFSAERRTKEIGIRKVLGASTFTIVKLLSKDFTRMVLIAVFLALPLSHFIAGQWLDNFAFRIELRPWLFIAVGLFTLLFAWLTVGIQTIKAAQVNPVDCLKQN